MHILRHALEVSAYIATQPQGAIPTLIQQRLEELLADDIRKTAGLGDFRLHDLRHSHASYLINSGRSIYEVSKILGHQQITTTTRYAHLSNDTLLDAVDAAAKATGTDWAAQLAT